MSKKSKKGEQIVSICYQCHFCGATLVRRVLAKDLYSKKMELMEQHIKLHRLARIGYEVRKIVGSAEGWSR